MTSAQNERAMRALIDQLLGPVASAHPQVAIGVLIGLCGVVVDRHPGHAIEAAEALLNSALRIAGAQIAPSRPTGAPLH